MSRRPHSARSATTHQDAVPQQARRPPGEDPSTPPRACSDGDEAGPEYSGGAAAVAFRGAEKRYPDGTVALAPIDLTVRDGEFVSVVGASGCGKSTLLRLASGLTSASAGTVTVAAETISYVFQDPTLLPWRSVRRNVEMLAELTGMSREEHRRRASEMIELVGLAGFERHRPRSLSGGMRMRVSLARSLVLSPGLFLLDEPFGALDEMSRERLNRELLRLFELRRFAAAIFVTHSVSEAVFLSTRVLVMSPRPGRLIAEFEVPFGYPRAADLRFRSDFTELTAAVAHRLREGGDE
ncbi:ABC transporter ATP-binding protein [Frankia sp. AgKG'84/4]|uniref:ABC transporter ATP-binding protein n=1 Tax=Frankia sp. AgKG'84/4 TaxID=573490 RepID=UPI002010732C|nr:ABC transporter ATP-binding protein [Frankia sp. AgKG'84/4]MCL9792847.1 ABC transporter ATP-binding protein [Frankia sp. AgKG'84/4]